MNKPIEPGCLCLSLDSVHPGQCTARYFVPAGAMFPTPDGLKRTIRDGWSCSIPDLPLPAMIATRQLMRIDGFNGNEFETAIGKMVCRGRSNDGRCQYRSANCGHCVICRRYVL